MRFGQQMQTSLVQNTHYNFCSKTTIITNKKRGGRVGRIFAHLKSLSKTATIVHCLWCVANSCSVFCGGIRKRSEQARKSLTSANRFSTNARNELKTQYWLRLLGGPSTRIPLARKPSKLESPSPFSRGCSLSCQRCWQASAITWSL